LTERAGGKIAFLHPGRLDTPTGGYAYDRDLIAALERAGMEVEVHGLGDGYPFPDEATLDQAASVLSALPDGTLALVDGLAFGVLDAVVAPHARRLRLVALVHHPLAHESGLEPGEALLLEEAERRALALARHVVVTSSHTARALHEDFGVSGDRISVVEPALALALPPLRETEVPPAHGPRRLLCVGSLIARKDHGTLLSALARLADRSFHLDLVGSLELDPVHADQIADTIARLGLSDRVTLHGALPRDALETLYANADLFVLTTLYEGYGMVFAEAMAHGLPIVATGEGAVRNTIPEAAGIVCENGAVTDVATAIAGLLDDPQRQLDMGAAARAHAETLPDWDTQAARLLSVLGRILGPEEAK
jgi:glycosyltransferase involved in cell wall biosynthesis